MTDVLMLSAALRVAGPNFGVPTRVGSNGPL